jgi:hypothetical protein
MGKKKSVQIWREKERRGGGKKTIKRHSRSRVPLPKKEKNKRWKKRKKEIPELSLACVTACCAA